MALTSKVREQIFNILRGAVAGVGTIAPYVAILLNTIVEVAKTAIDAQSDPKSSESIGGELELVQSNLALIWNELNRLNNKQEIRADEIVQQLKHTGRISDEMLSILNKFELKIVYFLDNRAVGREFEQVLESSLSQIPQGKAILTRKLDEISSRINFLYKSFNSRQEAINLLITNFEQFRKEFWYLKDTIDRLASSTSSGASFVRNVIAPSPITDTGISVSAKYTKKTEDNKSVFLIKLEFQFRGEALEALDPSLVFCIDASDSMIAGKDVVNPQGQNIDRLSAAKEAVQWVVDQFVDDDLIKAGRVGLVAFGTSAKKIFPIEIVNQANKKELKNKVQSIESLGFTNISDGLEQSGLLFNSNLPPTARTCVLLSDGGANRGEKSSEALTKLAANIFSGIKLHTIGIGKGYNENLLQACAKGGGGQFFDLGSDSIGRFFNVIINRLKSVFLEDVYISVKASEGYQCRWLMEIENSQTPNLQKVNLPNMYGNCVNSCYLIAETENVPSSEAVIGTIEISGTSPNGRISGKRELVLRGLEHPNDKDIPPVFMAAVSREQTINTLVNRTMGASVDGCKQALLIATKDLELYPEDIQGLDSLAQFWEIFNAAHKENHKELLAMISSLSQLVMQDYESDQSHASDCIKKIFSSAKPHLKSQKVEDHLFQTSRKLVDWALKSQLTCSRTHGKVYRILLLEIQQIASISTRLKSEFEQLCESLWDAK
ncbi:MAG: VWA domain-containing protein [Xenococcus sp. (in: cyanobacteria)]